MTPLPSTLYDTRWRHQQRKQTTAHSIRAYLATKMKIALICNHLHSLTRAVDVIIMGGNIHKSKIIMQNYGNRHNKGMMYVGMKYVFFSRIINEP